MCEAMRVLMRNELEEERKVGLQEGLERGMEEGRLNAYISLVKDGTITMETGARKAGMPLKEFEKIVTVNG